MKAREIAEWIFSSYPDECEAKLARSKTLKSHSELLQQLVAEIGANRPVITRRFPQVRTTEGRPRLYYWSAVSDEDEVKATEQPSGVPEPLREAGLYPKLAEFLRSEFDLHSQRIDEKRSANRRGPQGNRGLFPDVVALEDLTAGWTDEIRSCVSQAGGRKARLWSFEVKLLLNRSNVREAYFQTVSNSSWANFAYLVTAELEGVETLKELRMLSALHGIGLIKLDADNPPESQVLIPAKERADVDWANCNRLADENSDFMRVVTLVRQFHQTGDPRAKDWAA
jgi:hypothetical protein